jgi:hypothetical protein
VKRSEVDVEEELKTHGRASHSLASVLVAEKPKSEVQTRSPRGSRLASDWALPDDWRDWAVKVFRLEPTKVVRMSLGFRDYWIGVPGSKGLKLDWQATWRNHVRRKCEED